MVVGIVLIAWTISITFPWLNEGWFVLTDLFVVFITDCVEISNNRIKNISVVLAFNITLSAAWNTPFSFISIAFSKSYSKTILFVIVRYALNTAILIGGTSFATAAPAPPTTFCIVTAGGFLSLFFDL